MNPIRRHHAAMTGVVLAGLLAGAATAPDARAQQTVHTPVLMGVGADQLTDQRQDDRLAHRPLAREDRTLLVGRELRQTQEGISAAAQPTPSPDSPRVRAQELLREDRARVKREAALAD